METQVPKDASQAVHAPVVVDAKTPEGVAAFLSYVDTLTRHSNTEIATAEAQRLEPYFHAMSEYVIEALQKPPPEPKKAGWKLPLFSSSSTTALSTAWNSPTAPLATPGALSDLFNAMAATTHATLSSDVVIVPSDIRQGPAADLFKGHAEFSSPYCYLGNTIEFGFLQAYEGGLVKSARSSTTFPVFTVDHNVIDALPAGHAEPLLRDLQTVLSVVNHDMLSGCTRISDSRALSSTSKVVGDIGVVLLSRLLRSFRWA